MICQRCHRETNAHTMSKFNTQEICLECKDKEKKHPEYAAADKAEVDAVRQGNYNFGGMGTPADLLQPKNKQEKEMPENGL